MKKKMKKMLCMALVAVISLLPACKKKESVVLYDSAGMQVMELQAETQKLENGGEGMTESVPETVTENGTEEAEKAVQKVKEENSERERMTAEEEETLLLVHICGAVASPGVYEFEEGDRLYHAIEKAGGFLPEADKDYLNQAWKLSDGMQICVPTREQTLPEEATGRQYGVKSSLSQWETAEDILQGEIPENFPGNGSLDKAVNINTASKEVLCTLPGIGEGKAQSIIDYREKKGGYETIEEIMNVEGIKEGLFEKIKSSITV